MNSFFNEQNDDDFDPNASNNPKPHEGKQICIIKKYYEKDTNKKGTILACDLIVLQPSPLSTYKPGDRVGLAWFVNESDQVRRRYERKRAGEYVRALLDLPPEAPYGKQSERMTMSDQPGCGLLIAVIGEKNGQYLNYRYEHIAGQDGKTMAHYRQIATAPTNAQAAGLPPQTNVPPPAVQMPASNPLMAGLPVSQPSAPVAPAQPAPFKFPFNS